MLCSIVITTYNEALHINRLLEELNSQVLEKNTKLLVFHCESSDVTEQSFRFTNSQISYTCIHRPNLGRAQALNFLFDLCHGDLIIRLDARTHINESYVSDIINLSKQNTCEVVAGVMVPIGNRRIQINNAKLMTSWIAFGGGRFKDQNYSGYMNSVYLGAFKVTKLPIRLEFDENHQISEDSDFFYRLTNAGGKIWQSNKIKANYFARETFYSFLLLAKNYGRGRALFVIKHGKFLSIRQIIPLIFTLYISLFIVLSFLFYDIAIFLAVSILFYFLCLIAHFLKNNLVDLLYLTFTTFFIHVFWAYGFLATYSKEKIRRIIKLLFASG